MVARRALLAIALVALLVGSVVGASAANTAINYDAGPNPGVEEETLTVAEHDRGSMGVLEYYDDNGELQELPAHLNTSKDEQVSVRFDRIADDTLGDFPRNKDSVSGLNASEWAKSGANSSALTVSNVTPAEGVEGVKFATDGTFASGDTATATFSNFSIESDAPKRVFVAIGAVEQLESGATVTINLTSTDGDQVTATVDSGAVHGHEVVATSTINGFVFQEKVSNMTVTGSGDGTMEDIQSVTYTVENGDATIVLTGLDAERKSKLDLGTHFYDADADGDDEEHTGVEDISGEFQSGHVGLTSLETLDAAFDDAVIRDLQVHGVVYSAADQPSDQVIVEYSDAEPDYPGFAQVVDVRYRIEVPQAIDLSHSGLTFTGEQKFASSRYAAVEYAEGSTKDLEDVDSWSDLSSTYGDEGETHELDATVSAGTNYDFHALIKLTQEDVDALQDVATGGAVGPVSTGGGFWSSIPGLGMLAAFLAGIGSRLAQLGPLKGFPWVF